MMYGTHMILSDCAVDPVEVWSVEPNFSCESARRQTEVREGKGAERGRGGAELTDGVASYGMALFHCIIVFQEVYIACPTDVVATLALWSSTRKGAACAHQDREIYSASHLACCANHDQKTAAGNLT